jgi:sulfur-oxidizing protein SoxY
MTNPDTLRGAGGKRRALVAGAAILPFLAATARAQSEAEPVVEAYNKFLAGRRAGTGRLVLDIPRIADNGNVVPVRIAMPGPFAAGAAVKSIHLFSEKNPVPQMAVFHFPLPLARVEVESRVRLAGTQRIAAVATMADGSLYSATADIVVTVSACIDGS